MSELIEKIDLNKWREALTLIIINNSNTSLIVQFAEKLEEAGMNEAAQACFLYSGTSDKVIESWVKKFRQGVFEGNDYETEVFSLFFQALMYSESFKFAGNELIERVYLEYLSLLYKKGLGNEAFEIMKQLKTPKHSMSLMVFIEKHMKAVTGVSKIPWKIMNVAPVKVKSKEIETKKAEKPVFNKELSHPEPRKAAFVEQPKAQGRNIPEPPKAAFPVPVKTAFPEAAKTPVNQNKPVPERIAPPPPSNEAKKLPFEAYTNSGQKFEEQQFAPPPGPSHVQPVNVPPPPGPMQKSIPPPPANILPPPTNIPPPVKKDIQEIPAAFTKPEPKAAKPIEQEFPQVPVKLNEAENKPRTEERKVAAPVVPRTVPPPRPPVNLPGKNIARPASEGVDLNGIPSNLMPLATKWDNAMHDGSITNNPRILKDVEVKMQEFFNKLKNQELSENTLNLVRELTEAFEAGDMNTVNKTHLELTNKTWNENGNWLTGMKRIIQAKQTSRGK